MSKHDLLAAMLHGRRKALAPAERPGRATAGPLREEAREDEERGVVDSDDGTDGQRARPQKRPCRVLRASPSSRAAPARAAPVLPLELPDSLTCAVNARSLGRVPARRALWWQAGPKLLQAGCWDAALHLRAPSVLQQDAMTHMELSPACHGGSSRLLAAAQANQLVRLVPYEVLRGAAEARQAQAREAAEAGSEAEAASSASSDDDGDRDGPGRGQQGGADTLPAARRSSAARRGRKPREAVLPLPWDELASHASTASSSSRGVLTVQTHQHVAALGWDPRRAGRLALVDRGSPHVTLLDLGAGGGGAGQAPDYRRSLLATSAGAAGGGGGGGAAGTLAYMRYGPATAPYTLAGAGRAGGEGAVVHLWDERRGRAPVSRLACPGGASLVAPLEASPCGTALLGVVHPGTLVVWDVRRASSATGGGSLLSLGASAPAPSAVVGSWDLLAALSASGCSRRPVLSSLAADPRDGGRLALLTQDGSAALWCLASASVTHVSPGADAAALEQGATAALGPGPLPLAALAHATSGPAGRAGGSAAAVCAAAGGLYGAWDPDVCGFWHPAAVPTAGGGGGAAVGPGLALADFRAARGSRATRSAAAAAGAGPAAAPTAQRPAAAGEAGAVPLIVSLPAAPLVPPPGAAPAQQAAVALALADWPLCVACMPEGDVVFGTLGGQLSYWQKR